MMKEIHKYRILRAERQDINSFGSHCYFGVYLYWIDVIHPVLHHKNNKQDRIRRTLTTLLSLEVIHQMSDVSCQNNVNNFRVVQLLFLLLCEWIKNFAFKTINLALLTSQKWYIQTEPESILH